ncbi:hypothetical protein IMZ48_08655 [Candidatus Bathyarchaeota archaeon]|nr:hypothetical protein [Candidatus Bathyarchaeota archaeon]
MATDVDDIDDTEHVPRPRNKWILYRQEKSRDMLRENPSLSAGEICEFSGTYRVVPTQNGTS